MYILYSTVTMIQTPRLLSGSFFTKLAGLLSSTGPGYGVIEQYFVFGRVDLSTEYRHGHLFGWARSPFDRMEFPGAGTRLIA